MTSTPSTAAGGLGAVSPLLGTRAAQAAVDALARQVTTLSTSLGKVAASLNRTATAHQGGVGNPSTLGGGKANGGGSTPYTPGMHWNNTFLGGGGNGGGSQPQTQSAGKGNGGWGRAGAFAVTALASAGVAKMGTMVSTNTTAQMMGRNSAYSWQNTRSSFARDNFTATDSLDAAQMGANLQRLGYAYGSGGYGRASTFSKNMGLVDPTLSASQTSNAMAGMASANTYNWLAGRGIGTIGAGGKVMNPTQLGSRLISQIGGTGAWTKGQAEYFMGDRGQGRVALDSMLRSGAIDQDQYAVLSSSMKAQTTFMANGGTAQQFEKAIADGDQKTLSKYGIKQTDANKIKNYEAKQRNIEDNMAGGFSKGLDHATQALGAFADALNNVTNGPLGSALGYGQGLTGTLASGGAGFLMGAGGSYLAKKALTSGALRVAGGTAARVGATAAAGGVTAGGVATAAGVGAAAAVPIAALGYGIHMQNANSAQNNPALAQARAEMAANDPIQKALGTNKGIDGKALWPTGGSEKADMQGDDKAGTSGARTVSLMRPVSGPITSKFGPRKSPGGIGSKNHKGIDFGAPNGAPIVAANSGKVVSAGMTSGGYGNQTIIDHGNGLRTMYAHQSAIRVSAGQTVRRGQNIGAVGNTGNSTGPHLHFEVHLNGRPVDPAPYLGAGGMAGSGNSDQLAPLKESADKSVGASQSAAGTRSGAAMGTSEADIIAAALGGRAGLFSAAKKGAANESTGAAPGGGSTSDAPSGSMPKGSVGSWIKQALGILNLDYNKYGPHIATIIQHESSGNPRAINKWDSNWKKGTPSKGIMQTIDSTFSAHSLPGHKDIWNPVDNIIAATRYALSRYGSMDNVPGIKSLMNGGGYKGYAVGSTNIDVDQIAKVHKGEMVLDAGSAEAFRQALKGNTPTKGLFGSGGGGSVTLQFHPGSVVLHASGPMNDSQATDFAKSFVNILSNTEELKKIAEGV